MNEKNETNDPSDRLLDRVAEQLRNQAVPEMPESCRSFDVSGHVAQKTAERTPVWVWALAVAAGIVVTATLWTWYSKPAGDLRRVVEQHSEVQRGGDSGHQGDVIEMEIASPPGLLVMQSGLDQIESELAGLRRQAERLDARRRASELIGTFAMSDRSSANGVSGF